MKQLIYVLQFKGKAAPVDASGTVMKAATTAPSCTVTTVASPSGVDGKLEPAAGEPASFESEVTFTGQTSFQECGTIAFGSGGNRLRFSTVGEGYIGPTGDAKLSHGSVIWRVEEGEGQLAGASGLITSNFTVSDTGEVIDNHFGVIFVE